VLRSGARPGDVVAVSGALGAAARGIELLFTEAVDADGRPDAARVPALRASHPADLAAQLTPRPPLADGVLAGIAGATAMLDLSDGLALDARRLAAASDVAIELTAAALTPSGVSLEFGGPLAVEQALRGGEDHSLLATFSSTDFPPGVPLPGGFRPIGRVRALEPGEPPRVLVDGVLYDGRGGWDPYSDWNGISG
jgi:thiamine-monophosphate kinase